MSNAKYNLEERLLDYAAECLRLVDVLQDSASGKHVGGQLIRSSTSPLFNHGEAQGAESAKDFVHKMSICLKELRECERALRLIDRVPLSTNDQLVRDLLRETDELIRIFVASIKTAKTNGVREEGEPYLV